MPRQQSGHGAQRRPVGSRPPTLLHVCVTVVTVLGGAGAADAQGVECVGVRALGMGGAFVAVADDASAVYWNPAGLATGALASATLEHQQQEAKRSDEGWDGSTWAFAIGAPPLGLAYYRLRSAEVAPAPASPTELTVPNLVDTALLVTDHVGVTVVQSIGQYVDVGAAIKVVRGGAASERIVLSTIENALEVAGDLDRRTSTRFDLDVGVMIHSSRMRAGLLVRNVTDPSFASASGESLTLDRQVRLGAAVLPASGLVVAVDVDLTRMPSPLGDERHVAVGTEYRVASRLAVRGGGRLNTVDETRPSGSVGASVGLATGLWLDGQVTAGDDDARGWGIGLRFAY